MQPEVGGTAQGAERSSALGSEDVGTAWELIILQISVQGSGGGVGQRAERVSWVGRRGMGSAFGREACLRRGEKG